MYTNILFDLDGTIIDSKEGIINAFEYALKKFNIEIQDRTKLEQFIGPPLIDTFINYYKFTEEQANQAIKEYREFYRKTGVLQNQLYPGIKQLIQTLCKNKKRVILATSKPEEFAKKILKTHGIKENFYFISGATLDNTRNTKEKVIKYAINNIENVKLEECIMIGDRRYDMEGAKINNIKSIGVTYGFGTQEELEKAGADYIVSNVNALENIIMNN